MHKTLSRRLAATGAATALAAGALVGATTVSAQAAPVPTDYTCTQAALGASWLVTVDSELPGIASFPQIPAGFDVGAALLSMTNQFTIPQSAYETLKGANAENLSVPDMAGEFGASSVGVDGVALTVSGMTDNGDGTWSSDITDSDGNGLPEEGTGTNAAFEAPVAGNYQILAPAAFTLVANDVPGFGDVPVNCALAAGASQAVLHTITVTKNASETIAKVKNAPVNVGERAKLGVTVAGPDFQVPSGKVVVKKGKKTVGKGALGATGKDTIKLDRLKRGSHDLKVKYKGDGYTAKSSVPLTLKVRR